MTGNEGLNENVPSWMDRASRSPYHKPSTAETVQRFHKQRQQQQRQQRKSEPAAYDGNVDEENEEGMSRFQIKRGPPDGSKQSHQPQDTSQNGKQESGEIEARQGWGHAMDPSQTPSKEQHPKYEQEDAKHEEDGTQQEVTDPVTHLSVTQHDITNQELKHTLENMPAGDFGETPKSKIQNMVAGVREPHVEVERLFPPNHNMKTELISTFRFTVNVGMGVILLIMSLFFLLEKLFGVSKKLWSSDEVGQRPWADVLLATITLEAVAFGLGVWGLRRWVENKVSDFWEEQIWQREMQSETEKTGACTPESTQWLNSFLASIWPLVNPDLFTSLADTLEDSMQPKLPKLINMINVEDLGQGSEAPRILGVRWLPADATARSTWASRKGHGEDAQGNTEFDDPISQQDPKNGEYTKDKPQKEQEENLMKVVEAEEGDFVSLEIAFAYRARSTARNLSEKAKNAHLFLATYLRAGLHLPIWVEIQGIVGVLRLRLQLTPDPPFLAQCTFTFMGQPKVKLSCMPMFRHGPNFINLPIISSFVQNSVDAAMAKYVAPKSLTLNLKSMLAAEDFKKDTNGHGVVVVHIKRAIGFKRCDTGFFGLKKGSADPYVSLSWTKFGKTVWSTRVIVSEMEPVWDETGFIIVSSGELNAQERLRVQLWDSGQSAADADLGFIDIGLNEVMQNPRTNGKMLDRRDNLSNPSTDGGMPCTLDWSLGYFTKTRIQPTQLAPHTDDQSTKNIDKLKNKEEEATAKGRPEAKKDKSHEIEQQKAQDKAREDEIIISSPPPPDYPSGILAIKIHQILGLGFRKTKKNRADSICEDDDQAAGDDLLSSYCTIVLNHQRIFKTRTKPKSEKPSFNAGIERFIRDWRTAEIILSVRDLRMHEHDPLVGVVVLPLAEMFKQRSQINDYFPLSGGIGHGRIRISMVFRSIQLQAPKEFLGWEYGTLMITSGITSNDLPNHYKELGLKLRTSVESERMSRRFDGWGRHQDQPVELAVRQRYRSVLIVDFQESKPIHNNISAFATLWLSEIPDNEEKTVTLPVWKGDLKRAEANCQLENGEKLGHIEVRLRFQPGISDHYKKLASKDRNIADVMDVLDVANDNKNKFSNEEAASHDITSYHEDGDEHDSSQLASKEHGNKLHRAAHKAMQWKSAHTVQRAKHKVENAGGHIAGHFQKQDAGAETDA